MGGYVLILFYFLIRQRFHGYKLSDVKFKFT